MRSTRSGVASFAISSQVRQSLMVLTVVPALVILGIAVSRMIVQNAFTLAALSTIPFLAVYSVAFSRLWRESRHCVRLQEDGIQMEGFGEPRFLPWESIARLRVESGGLYARLRVEGHDGSGMTLRLWYDGMANIMEVLAQRCTRLGEAHGYEGESARLYDYFQLHIRSSLMVLFLASVPAVLLVPQPIGAVLVVGSLSVGIFAVLAGYELLVLPFQYSGLVLAGNEIRLHRFAWRSTRISYEDIETVRFIAVRPPPGMMPMHVPLIQLETRSGTRMILPIEVCRNVVACCRAIRERVGSARVDWRGPRESLGDDAAPAGEAGPG